MKLGGVHWSPGNVPNQFQMLLTLCVHFLAQYMGVLWTRIRSSVQLAMYHVQPADLCTTSQPTTWDLHAASAEEYTLAAADLLDPCSTKYLQGSRAAESKSTALATLFLRLLWLSGHLLQISFSFTGMLWMKQIAPENVHSGQIHCKMMGLVQILSREITWNIFEACKRKEFSASR